ncbi:SRPBCC family protein [Brumimicrobium aurantiacum]|uniref:Polyketide cyclase n=1 Tax=Brumimicrobium aurantiacum TaxID=1737063 RepID=A0A3E1EW38_9FLAO|nr:SRPBCC family protein [Brumimicrobium aurantiacum]RFC53769.1 polyketide cyclase [Brumimicrobium aurantiacum]
MKALKRILIVLAIILTIPLIVAAFIKGEYTVEESIIINQPEEVVFAYIKHLKNQDNFTKWAKMDPDMEKTYTGTDGTVGFVSAWKSDIENVGVGEQEILSIKENEKITFELRFLEPFESTQEAYMSTDDLNENQTEVKWGFSGKMYYPMNFMLLFMDFEEMIGEDFQEGLKNLKVILEKKK